jgi:hypothetical protein
MHLRRLTACLALSTLFAAEYSAAQEVHTIGPLRVNAPTQGSWSLARKTDYGVVFRSAEQPDVGDTIAYVNAYRSRGPLDGDGLLAEVKANVASFLQAPNARITSTSFTLQQDRPYPCVAVRASMEVSANTNPSDTSIAKQMRVHICQPKGGTTYGFVVGFAYTARSPQEGKESQADAFFGGVQVPGIK